MAKITFYEKTGCINNTKQKKILTLAGHEIKSIDLVKYPWTAKELKMFFEDLEVSKWFNLNAPSVSNGSIVPENFTEKSALEAMLDDHLLIKDP